MVAWGVDFVVFKGSGGVLNLALQLLLQKSSTF